MSAFGERADIGQNSKIPAEADGSFFPRLSGLGSSRLRSFSVAQAAVSRRTGSGRTERRMQCNREWSLASPRHFYISLAIFSPEKSTAFPQRNPQRFLMRRDIGNTDLDKRSRADFSPTPTSIDVAPVCGIAFCRRNQRRANCPRGGPNRFSQRLLLLGRRNQ
jgi:hypothetical protein